jgi:aerobic carbon-monoxide dehydrogenase small subunit
MTRQVEITTKVNGRRVTSVVDSRLTAADWIRDSLGLRGTHLGCEHGVCGACTILVNGVSTRSCLLYAPQLGGAEVMTVEALAKPDGTLHPLQRALTECHGLQCGFCTPGFLMVVYEYLSEIHGPTRVQVREALTGNLCRCTGYQGIVDAVMQADREWQR